MVPWPPCLTAEPSFRVKQGILHNSHHHCAPSVGINDHRSMSTNCSLWPTRTPENVSGYPFSGPNRMATRSCSYDHCPIPSLCIPQNDPYPLPSQQSSLRCHEPLIPHFTSTCHGKKSPMYVKPSDDLEKPIRVVKVSGSRVRRWDPFE